jgi:hypothetical protein
MAGFAQFKSIPYWRTLGDHFGLIGIELESYEAIYDSLVNGNKVQMVLDVASCGLNETQFETVVSSDASEFSSVKWITSELFLLVLLHQ